MKTVTSESAYYTSTPEDDVEMIDPLTGEVMKPGVIPESLLSDDELRKGFDFWRENAGRVQFSLLLCAHGAKDDMDRAGIDLHAEAVGLAFSQGTLFLEGKDTTANRVAFNSFFNSISTLPADATTLKRAELTDDGRVLPFLCKTADEIAGTGVKIIRPDYLSDSERPVDRVLTTWGNEVTSLLKAAQDENTDPTEILRKFYYTNAGFTVYRDMYLIGKVGSYFAAQTEATEQAQSILLEQKYIGKMLVGPNHRNIGRILENWGAHVDYVGTEPEHQAQTDELVQSVGAVSVSAAQSRNLFS